MKKLILLLFLLLLCPLALAEESEYVLKGHQSPSVMTQAGTRAFFPDGLTVYPQVNLTDEDDPMARIPVRLPGMNDGNAVELLVCRADILRREDYTGVYDLPTARISSRVPLYASTSDDDRGVLHALVGGDVVTVLAHIGDYFYVAYESQYGYVRDDAIMNFRHSETSYRIYNRDMTYSEFLFAPGEADGTEAITADQALALAREYLIIHQGETVEHMAAMITEVELSVAHIYGEWGKTWFIQFFIPVGESDADAAADNLQLYYTLDVRVDNGEVYLVNVGDYG